MQPTKVTIYVLFAILSAIVGYVLGFCIGMKYLNIYGGIGFGLLGMIIGYYIGFIPDHIAYKSLFKKIERSSNEDLWNIININIDKEWDFRKTLALLELRIRNQDISKELSRVINVMESEDEETRLYGWDALRLVFRPEIDLIKNYDPRESANECRNKAEAIKSILCV